MTVVSSSGRLPPPLPDTQPPPSLGNIPSYANGLWSYQIPISYRTIRVKTERVPVFAHKLVHYYHIRISLVRLSIVKENCLDENCYFYYLYKFTASIH